MAAVTIHSDFGVQENKVCHCFHCFPIYLPWSDGPDAMIFVFWMLSFKCWEDQLIQLFIKPFFIVFLGAWTVLGAGDTMETATDFIFLDSKITVDGDATMKLKDSSSLEEKL